MRLAAFAFFLDDAEATVKDVTSCIGKPAVLQVPLSHVGLVKETIVVLVVMSEVVLIVEEYLGT